MRDWLIETRNTYFGNATAMRDFRVQLRGNRSVILFGLYLVLLIGIAMLVYSQTAGQQVSIVEAQRQLQTFYQTVMTLLAVAVTLITPALSATSVVMERQRKSLDLVFSAPVSPKYYLVGKMISSFRYTWMLLVLALPITAACVVLGGASWSDVLISFLMLSMQGLVLSSIALLMSTVAQRPLSAIIWSYAAVGVYLLVSLGLGSMLMATMMIGRGGGNEAPFFVAMNPFLVVQAAPTYSVINGWNVPNWIFTGILSVLISKIALQAAGAALSPYGSKETIGLRVYGLIYVTAILAYGAAALGANRMMISGMSSSGYDTGHSLGMIFCWVMMPGLILIPFLACYGFDNDKRYWPNGVFRIRHALDGTPSGGLPYICAFVLLPAIAGYLGFWATNGTPVTSDFFVLVAYSLGLWTFFWALGRWASSLLGGLKTARVLVVCAYTILLALPVPVLSAANFGVPFDDSSTWVLYPLYPIISSHASANTFAGADLFVMLFLAAVILYSSERRLQRKVVGNPNVPQGIYAA